MEDFMGVYKIQNLIDGKIYIGESIHIKQRWMEHCQKSSTSVISNAIHKYGVNNFSFEILELCEFNKLKELERYYMKKYDCMTPKGYNIKEEDEEKVNVFAKYDKETFLNIIQDLKENLLPIEEISSKYNLDKSTIYYINRGEVHKQPDEVYPIRQVLGTIKSETVRKKYFCKDCGKQISPYADRCWDCYIIQEQNQSKCPAKEELLEDLEWFKSWIALGRKYSVSDNTVKNWFRKYEIPLPVKEKQIKIERYKKYQVYNQIKTATGWEKYLGTGKHRFSRYANTHSVEETEKYIKDFYDKKISDGDIVQRQE